MIEITSSYHHNNCIFNKSRINNSRINNSRINNCRISIKPKIINKAFQSLSFRGNQTMEQKKPRQKTYGAILRSRNTQGETIYALVQGRYTGKWSFPKGHSNEWEQPLECTLREVGEETGIDMLPEPDEFLHVGYGDYFLFEVPYQLPLIPRDTKEIMNTKWVTIEEMETLSLNADANMYRKQLV